MERIQKRVVGLLVTSSVLVLIVAACGGSAATATPQPTAAATRAVAPTPAPTPSVASTPAATPTSAPTVAPTAIASPAPTQLDAPVGLLPSGTPKYGGTLQASLTTDWSKWDTYTPEAAGYRSEVLVKQLLSSLIQTRKNQLMGKEVVGDTAASWETSGDGKTYTFRLRKDVVWSDGKPFTSADVIYNLQRAGDAKTTWNRERVKPIATMETPDPYTVKLTLKAPSNAFLLNLATPFMLMYPPQVPDLTQWQKSPVGTGAFIFVDYKPGVSHVYRKNTNYYGKDAAGRQLPYLDGVVENIITDRALALGAFRTGRINCGCGSGDGGYITPNREQLKREIPGLNLAAVYTANVSLMVNIQRSPLDNLAFRQALAISLDKQQISPIIDNGSSWVPAPLLYPPQLGGLWGLPREEMIKIPGYNPDHAADLTMAKQKLRESGVDPARTTIEVVDTGFNPGLAEAIAASWSTQLGLKTKVNIATSPEQARLESTGAFDFAIRYISPVIDDPASYYNPFVVAGGTENIAKYSNDRIEQLARDQDLEIDPVKRRAQLWEMQRIHLTEFPTVSVFWIVVAWATRPEVKNYNVNRIAIHAATRLDEVWLDQ